jgi:hypothetical protein
MATPSEMAMPATHNAIRITVETEHSTFISNPSIPFSVASQALIRQFGMPIRFLLPEIMGNGNAGRSDALRR